jgi:hypothetical protein
LIDDISEFAIGATLLIVIALVKPTINFVGSFATPCKQSFYNSSTLFEASRNCILKKVGDDES